jgi:TRAP-type C4-dicarboxylate transport system permease large subunit
VRIPELRDLIKQGYETTMRITTMVVFILIGSTCFSVVFLGVSGGVWLEHLLTSLPGGVWGFLIFINLFIFFLAFFLDFFEIAFIILPMIAPIAQKILTPVVGADAALIWFGVMLCVNMQTSFMHPPFGFALFYLRGVAPKEVKSSDIYWGALPWVSCAMGYSSPISCAYGGAAAPPPWPAPDGNTGFGNTARRCRRWLPCTAHGSRNSSPSPNRLSGSIGRTTDSWSAIARTPPGFRRAARQPR